jgi:hypothetical protein
VRFERTIGLKVRTWPGEEAGLVFSSTEAKTHLVDSFSARMLTLAHSYPIDVAACLQALDLSDGVAPDTDFCQEADVNAIQKTLEALESSGFLRRCE